VVFLAVLIEDDVAVLHDAAELHIVRELVVLEVILCSEIKRLVLKHRLDDGSAPLLARHCEELLALRRRGEAVRDALRKTEVLGGVPVKVGLTDGELEELCDILAEHDVVLRKMADERFYAVKRVRLREWLALQAADELRFLHETVLINVLHDFLDVLLRKRVAGKALFQGGNHLVDFFFRVRRAEADADGAAVLVLASELVDSKARAMDARAADDAMLGEQVADFFAAITAHVERYDRQLLNFLSINDDLRNLLKLVAGVLCNLDGFLSVQADSSKLFVDDMDGGMETHQVMHSWRADLEGLRIDDFRGKAHGFRARPAEEYWLDMEGLADVEAARPLRAVQSLVSRKRDSRRMVELDVDSMEPDGLRGIQNERNTVLIEDITDGARLYHVARDIAPM